MQLTVHWKIIHIYILYMSIHIHVVYACFTNNFIHIYVYTYIDRDIDKLTRSKCGADKHSFSSKHEAGTADSLACTLGGGQ